MVGPSRSNARLKDKPAVCIKNADKSTGIHFITDQACANLLPNTRNVATGHVHGPTAESSLDSSLEDISFDPQRPIETKVFGSKVKTSDGSHIKTFNPNKGSKTFKKKMNKNNPPYDNTILGLNKHNLVENCQEQFQRELANVERSLDELKMAIERLENSQNTENKKKKSAHHQDLVVLKGKVMELEEQKTSAEAGFQQACLVYNINDSLMRKRREIFRLKSRLPALAKRKEFEQAVKAEKYLVVMGQTGSGKSTQLVQYVADVPEFCNQIVICTQPRKIAAVSLAKRVAFEFVGGVETPDATQWVGYHVGGAKVLHRNNRIQFMTESVLLNQLTADNKQDMFANCCAIVVDEAHCRSLNTDLLLGVLKREMPRQWPHLRLIVTSATIDTALFSGFLFKCPVIEIPGRLYPVDVFHRPYDKSKLGVIEATVKQALEICSTHASGHVLCFLTGQSEVQIAKEKFLKNFKSPPKRQKKVVVYALYGKQTFEEQQQVFLQKPDEQKVIFSTDIAETSVTIDEVRFIVDCGLTKNVVFDTARSMTTLKEMTISAASAEQRKGRAGRTGPGTCYRLFSEEDYSEMPKFEKAEILQRPLAITFTLLKAMGIDPFKFEWLENPEPGSLESAVEELTLIGAIDHQQELTELGKLISDLQVDPGIARMIQYGCHNGLGKLATMLAGLFSVSNTVFWRGGDEESIRAADVAKKRFESAQGDIIARLSAFNQWVALRKKDRNKRIAKDWCMENYVNNRALNMAVSTTKEIENTLLTCAPELWQRAIDQSREEDDNDARQLIAQALMLNVALKVNGKNYVALRSNVTSYIHPSSAFLSMDQLPEVVVFQYILRTSKTFAVQLTPIELEWIWRGNEALHAFYEARKLELNVHEIKIESVSFGILRDIVGPGNRHLDGLSNELDCFIQADFSENTLVAWCKFAAQESVYSKLNALVEDRRTRLRAEVQETAVTGDTRVVWGCGGKATKILRTGEFISMRIQNVSCSVRELERILRDKATPSVDKAITTVSIVGDKSKTGKVSFRDSESAALAYQEWSKKLQGAVLRPVLTNAPSAFKQFSAHLEISFALAPSQKTAILLYDSMGQANIMLTRYGTLKTQPLRRKVVDTSLPRHQDARVEDGRFVETPNPFNVRIRYGLYVPRLPPNIYDEDDIKELLIENSCPLPFYIKVNRGVEIHIPADQGTSQEEQYLNYMKKMNLLPLAHKVKGTTVKKDGTKKKITVRAKYEDSDDLEIIAVSGLQQMSHCDEPVRMKATYTTSLRIDKKFWPFRDLAINQYLKTLSKKYFTYKIDERSSYNVWIHMEVNKMEVLRSLRKKINELLQSTIYRNEDSKLLFTTYGLERVHSLDLEEGFIFSDVYSKTLRIYGDEDEQQKLKLKLDDLVNELKDLELDVQIYVKKKSKLTKDLNEFYNGGLRGKLKMIVNRIYASGTKEGIETLRTSLKGFLLEERKEIATSDCFICTCPLENPYCLQICAHKFCTECIQSMLKTLAFPIVCPIESCGEEVCLKDIQNIAQSNAMDIIAQYAIKSIIEAEPSKYRRCFKNGCEQIFVMPTRVVEQENEKILGGNLVWCEMCGLDYCCSCSVKMNQPIERHRGLSCAQVQRGVEITAGYHRLYILDELCMLRCPRCKAAFYDFDGCCALWCAMPLCKAAFCFFCLADCGSDAHNHVRQCPRNPNRNEYYIQATKKNSVHKEERKAKIVKYLMSHCRDPALKSEVLDSLKKDLQDLEIVINPSELGLQSSDTPQVVRPINVQLYLLPQMNARVQAAENVDRRLNNFAYQIPAAPRIQPLEIQNRRENNYEYPQINIPRPVVPQIVIPQRPPPDVRNRNRRDRSKCTYL